VNSAAGVSERAVPPNRPSSRAAFTARQREREAQMSGNFEGKIRHNSGGPEKIKVEWIRIRGKLFEIKIQIQSKEKQQLFVFKGTVWRDGSG
jgi:hypothetical protein